MLDGDSVDQLRSAISDRYTAEELVEILGLSTEDIFDRFVEEVLRTDWTEL